MESFYPAFLDTLTEKNREYFLNNYTYVRKDENNESLETWELYLKKTREYYSKEYVFTDRIESVLPNGSKCTVLR